MTAHTRLLLFTLLLPFATPQKSAAQLTDTTVKTKYVEMRFLYKEEVLPGKINFSGVRVLDNRADTTKIGYVFDYPHGKIWARANLKNGVPAALTNYINRYFHDAFGNDKDSLLVIVNDFRISCERFGSTSVLGPEGEGEPWFIRLRLQLARISADSVFPLGACDTLLIFRSRNADYDGSLIQSLRTVLIRADALAKSQTGNSPGQPEDQYLSTLPMQKTDYPVLKATLLIKGAYQNFNELIANTPRYSDFTLDSINGTPDCMIKRLHIKDSMGRVVDPNLIWGFCDGKFVYVKSGGCQFYPFVRDVAGFTATVFQEENAYRLAAMKAGLPKQKINVVGALLALPLIFFMAAHNISAPVISGGDLPDAAPRAIFNRKIGGRKYSIAGTEINMQTGEIQF